MDFTTDQLKSLKEGFCREKIRSALSTENRPKKRRYEKLSWEKLDSISRESVTPKPEYKPTIYYMRLTSEGATPISKEKYLIEREICPSSWSYIWGSKRDLMQFIKEKNIKLKGELK